VAPSTAGLQRFVSAPSEEQQRDGRPGQEQAEDHAGRVIDHLEGAQEVAGGIAQEYPEYEAMAEAVSSAAEMVAMAYELEAYSERGSDD